VNECGLRLDLDAAPQPGRFVFAYRKTAPARPEPCSDHLTFRKLAA
jgi:hypothetical protein